MSLFSKCHHAFMTPTLMNGKIYNVCNICGQKNYEITENMTLCSYSNDKHINASADDIISSKNTFIRSLYDPTYSYSSNICSKCNCHKKYILVKGKDKIELCPMCGE